MRLLLLALVLGAATIGIAACRSTTPSLPERRPNVIYILADDLGWAELGCYGQEKIRTPNIDRIAHEGIRFTQHYSGSPVCAPSRCVLLTGLHSGHTQVRDNKENGGWDEGDPEGQHPLAEGTKTLGTLFRDAGYATAAIGKWGLGGPGSTGEPNRQGFDFFYGYLCQRVAHNLYPTHLWRNTEREDLEGNVWGNLVGATYSHDRMAEEALAFIREHADEPFFLYVPFHIPHLALQAPEDSLAEYSGAWEDPPYDGKRGYLPHPEPRAAYAAMVTHMDRDVGRIIDLLEELGLDEQTVVMFSSDNGATYDVGGADSGFFGSAGILRGLKGSIYEGGLRVPLVARWPGRIAPGRESDHISAFQDMLPTFAALAGVDPGETDGMSLLPELLGDAQEEHDYLYWEFPSYTGQQAVRVGRWKGVRRDMKNGNREIELYELEDDPGETLDVAAEHPDLVEWIRTVMHEEHEPNAVFPMPLLDYDE